MRRTSRWATTASSVAVIKNASRPKSRSRATDDGAQVYASYRLPRLVAYVALLFVAWVTAWRVAARDRAMRPVALGLGAGLFAVHIFGLVDAMAVGAKPGFLLWMSLGLLAALARRLPALSPVTAEANRREGAGV